MHETEPLKRSQLKSGLRDESKNLFSIWINPFFMILIENLDLACLTWGLNQIFYTIFLLKQYKIFHEKAQSCQDF